MRPFFLTDGIAVGDAVATQILAMRATDGAAAAIVAPYTPGSQPRGIHSHRAGTLQVPIVPMSVKAPVAASMLYIETLFEPGFVT